MIVGCRGWWTGRRAHVVALLIAGWLCAGFSWAQEQSGSIQGIVKDSSGGVLPGVTVEARDTGGGGVTTAITDERGEFRFPALPPGRYEVTATLQGFAQGRMGNVVLALGALLKVDLTLSLASVQESVQVRAEAPLIDTKQNASATSVTAEVIDRIPKGRDFTSVVRSAPGAQDESKSGGIQVDGASGSENRFVIDGIDTTNVQTGITGSTMLNDFIAEVQVKSSGYNAEFGGATGGVVNAITKSGTNQLRGTLSTYYQTDKFYGALRPSIPRYAPSDSNKAETDLMVPYTPWQYIRPVVDLGGPVLRDRLWFYAGQAYERNRYDRSVVFTGDPVRALRHFEWGNWNNFLNYNVTTQLSDSMRLRVGASNQRSRARGGAPALEPDNSFLADGVTPSKGFTTASFDNDPEAYRMRWDGLNSSDSRNDVVSGNLDWVLTSRFFINATAGVYRQNTWTPPEYRGNALIHAFSGANSDATMIANGYPTVPAAFQQVSGYTDNPSSSGTLRDIQKRLFFNANAIYYRSWLGQHVMKAGMRFEQFGNDVFLGNTQPTVTLFWGQTYAANDGRILSGPYGYYRVRQSGTVGDVTSNNIALWLQDSWTLTPRLTVNAGVRAENERVPSYSKAEDAIGIEFGFQEKISPRLGFAWDVAGNGKWKGYGSFGWFYDITKLELPRTAFGGDHWVDYFWSLDTYDWKSINCGEGRTGCPGTFYEEWDARRSSNRPDPVLSEYFGRPMTGIDPDLQPLRTGEMTLGLDHELNRTTSIGVRYVHKWLTRTIEDVGILVPGVGEVYVIGNPGENVTRVMLPEYPQFETPRAVRDYDSVELRLRRRLSNRWSADISYTRSRLWGNYAGLASSDEVGAATGQGRTAPNVNRYFDSLYMSYDRNQQAVYGYLPTDRPHVLRAQATYDLPWGTTLGAYQVLQSGTPLSETFTWQGYPVYPYGRGNLGRLPTFSQTDLLLQHEFKVGGRRRLSVMANIANLFDQKVVTQYFSYTRWRDGVSPEDSMFFDQPWDPAAVVAHYRAEGSKIRDQQLFMKPRFFQGPREIQLQARFSF